MRVFKFGGASVKNAKGVKNLLQVLQHEGIENTLVVVSAMGKMTNAFEKIVHSYLYDSILLKESIENIKDFHIAILNDLFDANDVVHHEIDKLFNSLEEFLIKNTSREYDYVYDQIVSYGELLSTKIISSFLKNNEVQNEWLDIRTIIKTNANYRNAKVDWKETQENCIKLKPLQLYITQGFISSSKDKTTTTLGREGSDFTAGILAYCLNSESVTIWKDVVGVLNADPRVFENTTLLEEISYQEAIEMAFYGASVIHPKTIKPLENKRIPLIVRSFDELSNQGTTVSKSIPLSPEIPCFIVKKNQILVSISANDFSFMVEENMSRIFQLLHNYKLKVNVIQNSAISFSVCLEDNFSNFESFYEELHPAFTVKYNKNLTLYTVRHFNENSVLALEKKGTLLLKQTSRETIQLILDEKNNYAK